MNIIRRAILRGKNNLLGKLLGLIKQPQPLLLIGPDSTLTLCDNIQQFGQKQVLLITDNILQELGVITPTVERLKTLGLGVSVYSGILPDPTFAQVREGIAIAKREGCDAVLAIGGGSVLDAAKAISAGSVISKDVALLNGFMKVKEEPLPFYCVPSTAGTGSEVSMVAVISDPISHEKQGIVSPKLLPRIAALDPVIMQGMPPQITAATGADALTHAIEAYISRNANAESDRLARTSIQLIFSSLAKAYRQGSDLQARQSMAVASTYAGLAFGKTFVGYVHAISHAVGGLYGVPHGLANAIVLPHVMRFSQPIAESRFAELAIATEIGQVEESTAVLAQKFVDAVQALMDELNTPRTIKELKEADMNNIANEALKEAHTVYNVPRYMNQQDCLSILTALKAP